MAVPRPHEILVDINLARYGVFPRRRFRLEPDPLGVTRSNLGYAIGRDGLFHKVQADTARAYWVDTDGDGIRDRVGILCEGPRTPISVPDPEDFTTGNWTKIGCVITHPFRSVGAFTLDKVDDNSAVSNGRVESAANFNFLAAGTNSWQVTVRYVSSPRVQVELLDMTTLARHGRVDIVFNGDGTISSTTPAEAASSGNSRLLRIEKIDDGLTYVLHIQALNIVQANAYRVRLFGTGELGGAVTDTGAAAFGGPRVENAVFNSMYSGLVSPVAEIVRLPIGFAPPPEGITTLVDLWRPIHADAAAGFDLGLAPGVFSLGTTTPGIIMLFDQTARTITGQIRDGVLIQSATQNIPAGARIRACLSARDITVAAGGKVKLDVGSGYGAESPAVSKFTNWGSQFLDLGNRTLGNQQYLFGVIFRLLMARGQFLKTEMEAY